MLRKRDDVLFGSQRRRPAVLPPGHIVAAVPHAWRPATWKASAQELAGAGRGHASTPPCRVARREHADGSMSLMVASADRRVRALPAAAGRACPARCFVISQRVGDGARTKLVNNLLAGINLVGAAEVLALAQIEWGWT